MAESGGPLWYLIHCKPRQERRALENLERQGFECFRPERRVERCREGVKYVIVEPLFPNYLFIHLDCLKDHWYPVRSTRGVNRIMCIDAKPVPVRDQIIGEIRARSSNPVPVEPYLKPGERVLVTAGPFSQLEAIFVANEGEERVVLLLNLLHTEQQLSFPMRMVRRVG